MRTKPIGIYVGFASIIAAGIGFTLLVSSGGIYTMTTNEAVKASCRQMFERFAGIGFWLGIGALIGSGASLSIAGLRQESLGYPFLSLFISVATIFVIGFVLQSM